MSEGAGEKLIQEWRKEWKEADQDWRKRWRMK